MWRRLGLERRSGRALAIGIENEREFYGLLIDQIGEVLKLPAGSREDNPINLDGRLAAVSAGMHRLDTKLMVVLDLDRIIEFGARAKAA
jgi:purine-binding chemotaxis protein CheW